MLDPTSLNRLGQLRQQDILDQAAQSQIGISVRRQPPIGLWLTRLLRRTPSGSKSAQISLDAPSFSR